VEIVKGDQVTNNGNLAEGTAGQRCILLANIIDLDPDLYKELIRNEFEHITHVEVFENGAMNLYVRGPSGYHAYILVRPSTPIVLHHDEPQMPTDLTPVSDQELKDELNRRGYFGVITK